jgi:hypothetical protein
MMGDFIAAILKMMKKEQFPEAFRMIENAYFEFLKEDAAFFRSIPEEVLTRELMEKHNYSHGHLEILGELFYAEAELGCHSGKFNESLEYYRKSKHLLEFLMQESDTFSLQKEERLAEIQKKIYSLESMS